MLPTIGMDGFKLTGFFRLFSISIRCQVKGRKSYWTIISYFKDFDIQYNVRIIRLFVVVCTFCRVNLQNTCFEKYKVRKEYKINDSHFFKNTPNEKCALLKQIRNVLSVRNFNHVIATLVSYMILYIIINIYEISHWSYLFII